MPRRPCNCGGSNRHVPGARVKTQPRPELDKKLEKLQRPGSPNQG
jgi:hypothetical protein